MSINDMSFIKYSICILCLVQTSAFKCDCRRMLGEKETESKMLMDIPVECFEPSDSICDGVGEETAMDLSVFDEDVAVDLVAKYCCALREDSTPKLQQTAIDFQEVCTSDAFLQWMNSLGEEGARSASQQAIAKYCPNQLTLDDYFTPTYTDLWKIARYGLPRHFMMKCDGKSKPSTGQKVIVTLHGIGEMDLIPHVWLELENGDKISWSPDANVDVMNYMNADFKSVTGVPGKFLTERSYELPPDQITFEVEHINVEALLAEKQRIIEAKETYDLISHNCAHVTLRLLAAGLGCSHRIIPFFSPVAMVSVMQNIDHGSYWIN